MKSLQNFFKTPFTLSPWSVLFIILSLVAGWYLGHRDYNLKWQGYRPDIKIVNQTPPEKEVTIDFKLFWDTWDLVSTKYIDKKSIDPQKLYYGAIQGMVAALGDPYTVFLPPQAQKSTKEQLSGSFEGVGMQLGYNKDKRLVIIAPLKGTPAEKAGIKSGDLILKIDDKDATALPLPEAVSLIRGPKGSKVKFQLFSENETKPKDIEVVRDTITIKSVEYLSKATPGSKKVAYLRVTSFGEKTREEWDAAVSDALADGPKGVVVDLRNNPGGFLESSVYLSSEFLDQGEVVWQEDYLGNRQGLPVNRVGKMLKLPVVVLINKGSASASEIMSGAIQDRNRGKLIGEQSFGKGTIQTTEDLAEGTGIHITTAKWLTPNGRWIHSIGLTPDIKVEEDEKPETDLQLDRALSELDKM